MRVLEAGRVDAEYLHAANIIGREYGLHYEVVGGCVESQEFNDSLDKHNESVYAQIAHEFGVDWEKHFKAQADSMEFLISQAESLVELETDYKFRRRKLEERKIILALWTEPGSTKEVFKVEAYEVSFLSPDSSRKVYYSWNIDLANHKVLSSDCSNCH